MAKIQLTPLGQQRSLAELIEIQSHSLNKVNHYSNKGGEFQLHVWIGVITHWDN